MCTKDLIHKYGVYLLIAVFGTILFFVNVKDSHDWGGDFAMYIMQAKNITDGNPQSQTFYYYNSDYPVLGPPAYPIGFPILLSPVYLLFGNSIKAFTLLITLFLFLSGILMVAFFRKYFPDMIAFFLAMLILFNPWTLMFKLEIMSDLPFTFFLLLATYLYLNTRKRNYLFIIALGLLSGYLVSIRSIGVVFPLAVLCHSLVLAHKSYVMQEKSALKRKLMEGLIVVLLAFGVNILLNRLIFQIPVADGMSYMGIFGAEPLWSTFISNLSYYFKVLEYFFTPYTHHWQWATLVMHAIALAFIILGFINHLVRKFNFIDILLLLYLGVILIYPYRHSGFRFLLPVIPYLMYYMVLGMNAFRFDFTLNRNVKILTLGILALSLYLNTFLHIQSERNKVIPGPQEEAAIAAFDYIRSNTPPDASIVFFKPRVLALYTSRLSMSNKPDQNPGIVSEQFEKMGVNYFLIHTDYSDHSLKQYVMGNPDWIQLVWENEKFKLYQRIP